MTGTGGLISDVQQLDPGGLSITRGVGLFDGDIIFASHILVEARKSCNVGTTSRVGTSDVCYIVQIQRQVL